MCGGNGLFTIETVAKKLGLPLGQLAGLHRDAPEHLTEAHQKTCLAVLDFLHRAGFLPNHYPKDEAA